VTRLFRKIDDLIAGEFDEHTIVSLNNAIDQLATKMEKIAKIDERLLELLDDTNEIESAVLDTEELNDDISDKIVKARRFVELRSSKQQDKNSPPVNQSSLTSSTPQPQETGNQTQASQVQVSHQAQIMASPAQLNTTTSLSQPNPVVTDHNTNVTVSSTNVAASTMSTPWTATLDSSFFYHY